MIALKAAPGGPEFIERVDAAAANLARFFIDTDEATIRAYLVQSRVNLEAGLGKILGRTAAVQIAEAFVAAVIEYRRRLRRAK
jgi:limonene-1,2-epoxide hydrolase